MTQSYRNSAQCIILPAKSFFFIFNKIKSVLSVRNILNGDSHLRSLVASLVSATYYVIISTFILYFYLHLSELLQLYLRRFSCGIFVAPEKSNSPYKEAALKLMNNGSTTFSQVWRMRFWVTYRRLSVCTWLSFRYWCISSSVHPDIIRWVSVSIVDSN